MCASWVLPSVTSLTDHSVYQEQETGTSSNHEVNLPRCLGKRLVFQGPQEQNSQQ